MSGNGKRLLLCLALSLALCVSQIRGSTILVLGCLVAFMALVTHACVTDYTLPVLLFFLPWGPVLRTDPTSFSFYTFALILICLISVLKKKFKFKRYHVVSGFLLVSLTLLSKLLNGTMLSFDYIAFMMLIFVFPVVKEEWQAGKYDFYHPVVFFSVGIITAALCAMNLGTYSNLAKFITVDTYLTIIRRSGFYGDANFYTAQITAALGGCLMELLKEKQRGRMITMFTIILLLLYCGFLSGSKSFILITLGLLLLWVIGLFRMQGRVVFKVVLITAAVLVAIFIATSELFRDLLDVFATRFSFHKNLSDFTTGRTDLWENYVGELLGDWKMLVLGNGFTNIRIGEKNTHNTLLQMVFQFGLLGTPILLMWSAAFFADVPPKKTKVKMQAVHVLLLVVGAFSPWLAIDALFFDEYFLLQMYVYLGLRRLAQPAETAPAVKIKQSQLPQE